MTKKKQNKQPFHQLSPDEYIKKRARSLPIYKCYINSYWIELALTTILVVRQHTNGNFTIGYYRVDTFNRGLYKSKVFFNQSKEILDEFIEILVPKINDHAMSVEIDYALAHNIIYGGYAFSKANGFKDDEKFIISKYILEDDTDKIPFIEINFGKNEIRERDREENNGIDNYEQYLT